MTKLVIGLGNLGKEFENTNHNMGFMVIDAVCKELNVSCTKKECDSLVAETNHNGNKVILAKPTTFMNSSGIAVKSLVKKYNIDMKKDLLIISDDIDLVPGKIRVREHGSAGTHNGLRSIIEYIQTPEFPRVRIGVGKPPEHMDLADFVLSRFRDKENIMAGIEKGKNAVLMFIDSESFGNIMQKSN